MRAFLFNQKMSFFLCFFFLVSSFLNTFVSPTQHLCHPDQSDALIEFKTEFEIQKPTSDFSSCYRKTGSWVNTSDCCSWDGITCDAKSGEVVGLNLSSSCLYGELKPDSSLFRLRHLRDLNLAYNDFNHSLIPAEFEKLKRLESLNLSSSSFSGQIPNKLLQLTKLVSLDLSSFSPSGLSIDESFLHLLARNLRNLRDLDMSSVGSLGPMPDSISNLKHLISLKLSNSGISGRIPSSIGNLSHLSYLDLSKNQFDGGIAFSIGNLKQLTYFDVTFNSLSGNFPSALVNSTQLRFIDLSYNQLTGSLPPNIGQLSKLEVFLAAGNSFVGAIPSSLFTISSLTEIYLDDNKFNDVLGIENISLLPNLQELYLGNNNFMASTRTVDLNVFSPLKQLKILDLSGVPLSTANITSNSVFPSHLEELDFSGCNITEFPHFIRNQRDLKDLDLSNNKIKGQVPDWLWRLPKLSEVGLSNNSLNGSLKPSPGSQISLLDVSSNAFQGPLFVPSTSIQYFLCSKNNFTGEIPQSLCGLTFLQILDLSSNNLHGSIPRCLETQMGSLSDLNLRNNSFSGSLPDIFMNATELMSLDVGHNRLEGKLPASLTRCYDLEVLNVESNRIKDTFPFQLNSLLKLQVLVLRSNKFHGKLHKADGVWDGFPQLKIVDASHNNFIGTLPSDYFMNWTAISEKIDTFYTQPQYIFDGSENYVSLVLMSKGVSMEMERILTIYTAIDFSGNQLHGKIPHSIGLLKELRILSLSSNAFTGHIPASLANLTNLESLDLSQNKLSGEIPPALGTLSSLEWINVSHNQLVGPIPHGTQFQRQNCSSYEGNPGIFAPSLKDVCGENHHAPTSEQSELPEPSGEEDEEWFSWITAGFGLVPGVVFGMTIGYIVDSYKQEWLVKTFGRNKHRSTRTR